ncbi:unnamed protein product [Tilletia controversa]|nr:unnamed protein product [Tilletia controversa]
MVETRSRTSRATLANAGVRTAGSAVGKAGSSTTATTTTTALPGSSSSLAKAGGGPSSTTSPTKAAAGTASGSGGIGRRVAANATNASIASSGLNPSRYSARSSTASTRQSTLAHNPVPPQLTSAGSSRPSSRANIASHPHQYHQQQQRQLSYRESQSSARLSTSHAATPVAGGATSSGTTHPSMLNHPYNTRKNNAVHTVNELIAGKIQEVYVLDDDDEGRDPGQREEGEEADRPSSAAASLVAQPNGAAYAHHHHQQLHQHQHQPYHPHQSTAGSSSGLPPPARPLTSDYPLHYTSARGQPAGVSVTGAYRPSPRLNGSVLRGASTASGRGSAIPQHHHYSSSNLGPPQSTAGAGKGKRKARDEHSSQYYSSNLNASGSAGQPSHYAAHPAPHLLSMQGQSHGNASSPALSTTSSNRYSQSVGVSAPAPHGALDRAMQAQHRAAAAAAAAAAADGSHYLSQHELAGTSQGSSATASAGTGVAMGSKRRRRDADGNYAPTGTGAHHQHHLHQHHPAAAAAAVVGKAAGSSAADYQIVSSRHAAGPSGAGGYYASPSSAAAYVPVASTSGAGAAAPASYRGGYPAGQGYVETRYGSGAAGDVAVVGQVPAADELPCDDKEGHYIVRPGEYVGPRYRIANLLGQGTFGKVVECLDVRSRKHVAVKVIRAIQKYRDASQIEIRVLKTLKDHDPLNKHQCIHLVEHFTYRNHVCIVTELLGKSVFDFLKENDFAPFPSMHIWSFAKQLLKSVAFLHRLGLVHTDLKPENILLVSSEHTTIRTNAATGGGSAARRQPKIRNMLRSTEIRLIDFGSATFDHEYHSAVVSTRHYRAPEIILGMGWSFPCDAWSIGCILVEFFTGDALFQTHDNLEHLAMMEAVLGVMPPDYRRQAEQFKPELFRNGRLNFPNPDVPKQSKRYVRQMKKLSDIIGTGTAGNASAANATYAKHNLRFADLIKKLLEFDPQRRMTVADALNHNYFELVEHEFPP